MNGVRQAELQVWACLVCIFEAFQGRIRFWGLTLAC